MCVYLSKIKPNSSDKHKKIIHQKLDKKTNIYGIQKNNTYNLLTTVLPAKSDNNIMFVYSYVKINVYTSLELM